MADKEIPANGVILAGEAVKYRHVLIIRQAIDAGLVVIGARELARIAAGFKQKHTPSGLGQPRSEGAAASTRPDDDVIKCVSHGPAPPRGVSRSKCLQKGDQRLLVRIAQLG